jgi:hypothetical protein
LIVLRDWSRASRTSQASIRLGVWHERWQRRAGDITGCEVRVEVLKNRFAPPGRCAHVALALDG